MCPCFKSFICCFIATIISFTLGAYFTSHVPRNEGPTHGIAGSIAGTHKAEFIVSNNDGKGIDRYVMTDKQT